MENIKNIKDAGRSYITVFPEASTTTLTIGDTPVIYHFYPKTITAKYKTHTLEFARYYTNEANHERVCFEEGFRTGQGDSEAHIAGKEYRELLDDSCSLDYNLYYEEWDKHKDKKFNVQI